ncbi:MAG: glycosyltransferase [Anaerolineales bacterium]|nr:glycosyltransferase [Anaerolineales bacterium]
MNILFLSRWYPYPTNNGSKLRIYNLLRGLSRHHTLTLLSFSDQPPTESDAAAVKSVSKEAHVVPWREFDPNSARARAGLFSLKPRSLVDTFSPEMAGKITQILNERNFDLIIASQFAMAAYYPYFGDTPALFEELELGLAYEDTHQSGGWARRVLRRLTWFKFHFYLSRLLKHIRSVSVVSEKERELVERNFSASGNISVIPNGMDLGEYEAVTATPQPQTMIFTGSFRYRVNYEAMVWFIGEVLPLILEQIPSAELIVTGDHLNLPLPSNANVRLTGYVDDVRQWIANSSVALVPIWSGGGTRLKALEAMALGTPVVATSKGAEGLNANHGQNLLIADTPQEFARCVIRLMNDRAFAQQVASDARQFVKSRYDWGVIMPQVLRLVERAAVRRG